MIKTYRLTLDYEIEINDLVVVPKEEGVYTFEMREKTQFILDALQRHPDVLNEEIKHRIFWGFLDSDASGNDLREIIDLQDEEEIMSRLIQDIPASAMPYYLAIFCGNEEFQKTISNEMDCDGRHLFISQIGRFVPLRGSFEEIGNTEVIPIKEVRN